MSASQGRKSKTRWIVATLADSGMEMGFRWNGLYHRMPTYSRGNDSIWVIVDRLSKVAHFLPFKTTYQSLKLAELYIAKIVSLHGVPKNIVSDRGTQFTSRFWKKVQEGLVTRLDSAPHIT